MHFSFIHLFSPRSKTPLHSVAQRVSDSLWVIHFIVPVCVSFFFEKREKKNWTYTTAICFHLTFFPSQSLQFTPLCDAWKLHLGAMATSINPSSRTTIHRHFSWCFFLLCCSLSFFPYAFIECRCTGAPKILHCCLKFTTAPNKSRKNPRKKKMKSKNRKKKNSK